MSQVRKVIFVCQGNTCRSPMAEVIFRHLLEKHSLDDKIVTASFGVTALDGFSASSEAKKAIEEYGLSLEDHLSGFLTEQRIAEASLILTMTQQIKRLVENIPTEVSGKVFTLGEYIGEPNREISDPIGGTLEVYKKCRDELEEILTKVVLLLKQELHDVNEEEV